jgi:hypothetical protein
MILVWKCRASRELIFLSRQRGLSRSGRGAGSMGRAPGGPTKWGPCRPRRLPFWHGRDGMAAQMMVSYPFQTSPTPFPEPRCAVEAPVPCISYEPDKLVSELEATSLR